MMWKIESQAKSSPSGYILIYLQVIWQVSESGFIIL